MCGNLESVCSELALQILDSFEFTEGPLRQYPVYLVDTGYRQARCKNVPSCHASLVPNLAFNWTCNESTIKRMWLSMGLLYIAEVTLLDAT